MRYLYISLVIIIILLSAIFRLGFPDNTLFGGDEDDIASVALNFINSHHIRLLGTSKGIYDIATIDILLYIVMQFIRDPRLIILVAIGIPNTVAVILCFLFCYRFMDKRTALLATSLFGFSNWAILYSVNLWGVDILQFFSILIFYLLALGIYKHKNSLIVTSILLLPLLPNLHLTSFSIFVSIFLILIIYYLRLNLRLSAFLIISVTALLVLSDSLLGMLGLESKIITDNFSLKSVFTTINLLVRGRWYFGYMRTSAQFPIIENIGEIFLKVMFIFGCLYLLKRMILDLKTKNLSPYLTLGFWYFIFIITMGITNLTGHAHYFMVVISALFIIASIGFFSVIDYLFGRQGIQNWEIILLFSIFLFWSPYIALLVLAVIVFLKPIILLDIVKKSIGYLLYSIIVFIVFYHGFSNLQLFSYIARKGSVPGRVGVTLGPKIKAAKYVINDAESRYKKNGLKSYYSIINDEGYGYVFRYLMEGKEKFISTTAVGSGYYYKIITDLDRAINPEEGREYERIGPVLVTVEKVGGI